MKQKHNLLEERQCFKPFNYSFAYNAWLVHEQRHWGQWEAKLGEDVKDWKKNLTVAEKNLLTHIFRFFTQADIDVAGAYVKNYLPYFPQPEVRMMLLGFAARECFDDKTEVLTDGGWKRFADLYGTDLVAQVSPENMKLSYVKPLDYIVKNYVGKMHHYRNRRTDICVTPGHRLWLNNPHNGKTTFQESQAGKWGRNFLYPVNGVVEGGAELSILERLLIAIQADGTIRSLCDSYIKDVSRQGDYSVDFNLTKPRKIEKITEYLGLLGLNNAPRKQVDGSVKFTFSLTGLIPRKLFLGIKEFSFLNPLEIGTVKADQIIQELMLWDGSNTTQMAYYNTNKVAIDKIQQIAMVSSYGCTLGVNRVGRKDVQVYNNHNTTDANTCYILGFSKENIRSYPYRTEVEYEGPVYCVTMPEGTVVTRRNGKVSVQGNCVHIAAYSHLIETLGLPETTYNEFAQYQEMKEKHEYLLGVSSTQNTKVDTAVHMAVFSGFTEGMQLFSSFIMLLNFSRQGKMRGMKDIITWSIRDEMMHCDGMTKLFREYVKENLEIWNDTTKSRIYAAAEKMVELEDKFIDLAFAMGDLVDLTKEEVKVYIRYITDRRLIGLGLKGIFKVKRNPLRWVEEIINSPIHGNFFETVVTDYAKGALTGSWDEVWA